MRIRLYRHLQVSCVGFIGVAIGALVGSHFVKVPEIIRAPLHRPGTAEEALDKVIPQIDLEEVPFNEAVARVRKLSPVPIVVNWDKLSANGIDIAALVTLRATDVTLGYILSEMVRALPTPRERADYAAANDIILISTSDEVTGLCVSVRSYDVRDLLKPDPWAPGEPREATLYDAPLARRLAFPEEELQQVILGTVAPETWQENGGGSPGVIRFFAGKLIIVQTSENHREITELLAELRHPIAVPPVATTANSELWNQALKKYVSTTPSVGDMALRRRIAEVRLDNVSFEQAVTMLKDQAHANLIVNWSDLASVDVKMQTLVSLHLHDVTLAEALHGLLSAVGAGQLDVRVNRGLITVGVRPNNASDLTTRVYDIRDWLKASIGVPPTPAPKTVAELSNWDDLKDAQVGRLVRIIAVAIAPDSWKELGGSTGSIKELNDELIVTQTWETQERVAELLAALRTDPARLRSIPATLPLTRP